MESWLLDMRWRAHGKADCDRPISRRGTGRAQGKLGKGRKSERKVRFRFSVTSQLVIRRQHLVQGTDRYRYDTFFFAGGAGTDTDGRWQRRYIPATQARPPPAPGRDRWPAGVVKDIRFLSLESVQVVSAPSNFLVLVRKR